MAAASNTWIEFSAFLELIAVFLYSKYKKLQLYVCKVTKVYYVNYMLLVLLITFFVGFIIAGGEKLDCQKSNNAKKIC